MSFERFSKKTVSTLFLVVLLLGVALGAGVGYYWQTAIISRGGPEDPLEAWSEATMIIWQYNTTHYTSRNMSTLMVVDVLTNLTAVETHVAGNVTALTNGGLIYCAGVQWNSSIVLADDVFVIEDYQGTYRFFSNQGLFYPPQIAGDPGTLTTGAFWYDTSLNKYKFYDGTEVQVLPSVGGGAANVTLAYKYTVYNSSSTYYMMDQTGSIKYSSTNACKVITFAIGNLTSGRSWEEWIRIEGYFTVTAPIQVTSYTGCDMRGAYFIQGAELATGLFTNASGGADYCHFTGGKLRGAKATYSTGSAFWGKFRGGVFEDMIITYWPEYGMMFRGNTAGGNIIMKNTIGQGTSGDGCKKGGILFDATEGAVGDVHMIANFLLNNGCFNVKIDGATAGTTDYRIAENHFAGNAYTGEGKTVGIWLYNNCHRVQIVNNHFEYIDDAAVKLNGTQTSMQFEIIGNTIRAGSYDHNYNNTGAVFDVGGSAYFGSIIGNSMESAQGDKPLHGIWLQSGSNHIAVIGNTIMEEGDDFPTCWGTAIHDDGSTNTVANNVGTAD